MKKLIVANWKMNPASAKEAVSLAKQIEKGIPKTAKAEVVIVPPFPYLESIKYQVSSIKLGAQNAFWENSGPYTGEISPSMLKSLGVEYVIIGHSERRRLGETDKTINKKVSAALKAGLKVILCVGEPERKVSSIKYQVSGKKNDLKEPKNFVKNQLKKDLKGISMSHVAGRISLIVAYEPVWAISTNKNSRPDKPEDALEMIKCIKYHVSSIMGQRSNVRCQVLYGGSVTSQNAKSFLQYDEIDGALVGGASLKPAEFSKIIKSAG